MGAHLGKEGMADAAAELDLLDLRDRVNAEVNEDEVPQDIRAFFGHPLAATSTTNGDDTHASALALLHEYQNLPAIDKNDVKIGDKYGPLVDLVREHRKEGAQNTNNNDYTTILNDNDVDAFLNKNSEEIHSLAVGGLRETSPQVISTGDMAGPSRAALLQTKQRMDELAGLDDPVASLQAQLEEIKNEALAASEEDSLMGDLREEIRLSLEAGGRNGSSEPSPLDTREADMCDTDLSTDVINFALDLDLSPRSTGSGRRTDILGGMPESSSFSSEILDRIDIQNRPNFDNIIIKPEALDRGLTEQTSSFSGLPPIGPGGMTKGSHGSFQFSVINNNSSGLKSGGGLCYSRDVNFGVPHDGEQSNGSPYDFHGLSIPHTPPLRPPQAKRPRKQKSANQSGTSQTKVQNGQKKTKTAKPKAKAAPRRRSNAGQAPETKTQTIAQPDSTQTVANTTQAQALVQQAQATVALMQGQNSEAPRDLVQGQVRRPQHLPLHSMPSTVPHQPQVTAYGGHITSAAGQSSALAGTTELTQLLIQHRTPLKQAPPLMAFSGGTNGGITPTHTRTTLQHPAQPLVTDGDNISQSMCPPYRNPSLAPPDPQLPVPDVIRAVSLPPGWHPPLVAPPPILAPTQNLRPWHPPMAAPTGTLVVAQHHQPLPPPPQSMPSGTPQLTTQAQSVAPAQSNMVDQVKHLETKPSPVATVAQPALQSPMKGSSQMSSQDMNDPTSQTASVFTSNNHGSDSVAALRVQSQPPPLLPINHMPSAPLDYKQPSSAQYSTISSSAIQESIFSSHISSTSVTGMLQHQGLHPVSSGPSSGSNSSPPQSPAQLAVSTTLYTQLNQSKPTQLAQPIESHSPTGAGYESGSCEPLAREKIDATTSQKAESSKKILQRLTEKIRRNQLQRRASSGQDGSGYMVQDTSDNVFNFESSSASSVCSTPVSSNPGTPSAQMTPSSQGPWPQTQMSGDSALKPSSSQENIASSSGASGACGQRPRAASVGSCSMQLSPGSRLLGHAQIGAGPVVVIAPQGSFHNGTYSELKSPDSGFNEAGYASSADTPNSGHTENASERSRHASADETSRPAAKRRRSSSNVRQMGGGKHNAHPVIPKMDPDLSGYNYVLETPISTNQRINEDRITYLNKGQFYGLSLQFKQLARVLKSETVKTNIIVVFRDDKSVTDELKCWEFWHSRQHSVKQRILDVDSKNSSGIVPNSLTEIAHNAVSLQWNPKTQPAKVHIAINCLSTDFSNQKGVKGLPLHVQVETYEENGSLPVHRAYCQIKIFCDKGAERKTRDEERRKESKSKMAEANGRRKVEELFHPPCDKSDFYPMANLSKPPVLFHAVTSSDDFTIVQQSPLDLKLFSNDRQGSDPLQGEDVILSPRKVERSESVSSTQPVKAEKILLYVREAHECVFTALLLHSPTLQSLAEAIEEKFNIAANKIRNVYKRCHKGILVKMDDNIIRHYSNESTFIILVKKQESNLGIQTMYDVTLAEIDGQATG